MATETVVGASVVTGAGGGVEVVTGAGGAGGALVVSVVGTGGAGVAELHVVLTTGAGVATLVTLEVYDQTAQVVDGEGATLEGM